MNPLVSISCTTYNHAPYIRKCLDGFLMQQCDFEFEIVIHDDASTDETQEIIKEYQKEFPDIIKPIFQTENQYSKTGSGIMARYNFPRVQGKYIALCEGDDYWTDPLKLQKQVDFMEAHPDYSLISGAYISKKSVSGEEKSVIFEADKADNENEKGFEITQEDFLKRWLTKTLTLMFRKAAYDSIDFGKYKHLRDVHLYYSLLDKGNGYYMKEVLGVYNIHPGGIFSEISEKDKHVSYLNVYGELYQHNKSDVHLKQKYYGILKRIAAANYNIKSKKQLYFKMFLMYNKWSDLKSLIKAIIKNR